MSDDEYSVSSGVVDSHYPNGVRKFNNPHFDERDNESSPKETVGGTTEGTDDYCKEVPCIEMEESSWDKNSGSHALTSIFSSSPYKSERTSPNGFETSFPGRPEGFGRKVPLLHYDSNIRLSRNDSQSSLGSAVDELGAQTADSVHTFVVALQDLRKWSKSLSMTKGKNTRLMKEYLYRKSLEGKERLLYENKRKIREALQGGKPIPTELRNEEAELRREIDLEDENTAVPRTHIDDEYAKAAERDPKILITTSRNPSAPLVQFAKELKLVFPNAQQMNRGGQVISEIIETCRAHDFTDVVLVHENRGLPDGLFIIHLPFGPTALFELRNVVRRHDIKDKKAMGTMPQVYPHVILDNFTTKLGERTANILKHLFPVPKPDTKRIITFANQSDYISFTHHTYGKHGGLKSIVLEEIGPRLEMRPFKIKLGTLDQNEAQDEWVFKPYMNTAKKQKFIGI
ncbi:PREDICTED: U3 small nucleolar ribonucleoprotein protein IMP4-like [Prunus mume]|uniref:U3 small nucleolar ribonucleoprotein protein IMP4-like n=1 Tax=Prunus mume TaxID=102107 RepID=A0ABM0PAR3_PRUMU|nr:PREDICTED: U3 small nucleolar ribonucleoprotein protein IMP4-like [Prunus mume]